MPDEESNRLTDRQIRFLREGLGKSDEEIEQLRQEWERMMQESQDDVLSGETASGDEGDSNALDSIIELLQRQREETEKHLDKDRQNEPGELVPDPEPGVNAPDIERLHEEGFDVITADGQPAVPAEQVVNLLEEVDKAVETSNRLIERIDSLLEPVEELDVEEERRNIDEKWQRIEEAKQSIGLDTTNDG